MLTTGDSLNRGYFFSYSSTADEGDDLDAIARGKQGASVFGAGDEFTVAFHSQVAGIKLQLSHECGDGCPIGNLARLAVEFDLHRSFQNVVL